MTSHPEGWSGPARVHLLTSLHGGDARLLGEEARELSLLQSSGIELARALVVAFEIEPTQAAREIERAFFETLPNGERRAADETHISLRPWFRTRALAQRAQQSWPNVAAIDIEALAPSLDRLWETVRAPRMNNALAVSPGGLRLRACAIDPGSAGGACSVDPTNGDPANVAVWKLDHRPNIVDRRTMRLEQSGGGGLASALLERVADIVDRAQMILGHPVSLEWALDGGQPVIMALGPVPPRYAFGNAPLRHFSLLWGDEGPIPPLAVDLLDHALRSGEEPTGTPRVIRVFARPYRHLEVSARRAEPRRPLVSVLRRAAVVTGEVAAALSYAQAFAGGLEQSLRTFDQEDLGRLSGPELSTSLRARQQLCAEAIKRWEVACGVNATLINALEAAVGGLPDECVQGLCAALRSRARRRVDIRLKRALSDLGEIPEQLDPVVPNQRSVFAQLRREMMMHRPLGLDLRQGAYGQSDRNLLEGMVAARDGKGAQGEVAQRQALRRLMVTARSRPLGRGRAALARSLSTMIERIARAKGTIGDGLSAAGLRLRDGGFECGRRLVDDGILEKSDDALYLHLSELIEAVGGEPGAYAARVRLRREEDTRWSSFSPPHRVAARRKA